MKAKQPIRRFGVDAGIQGQVATELSNRTPLSRTAGHVHLICPVCGTGFTRKASEAKRHAVSYCSRACAGFACRQQVEVACRVCGKPFTVIPSRVGEVTCCGEECRRKAISESTSAMDVAGWKSGMFAGGERGRGAKLTEKQARAILSDTRVHADIAEEYGISRSAVSYLKRGDTWAHLRVNAPAQATTKAAHEVGQK